jgi:hypothetical protein
MPRRRDQGRVSAAVDMWGTRTVSSGLFLMCPKSKQALMAALSPRGARTFLLYVRPAFFDFDFGRICFCLTQFDSLNYI